MIGEEKHMGSRAVIVLCRDEETAHSRFRTHGGRAAFATPAAVATFFSDAALTAGLLDRLSAALDKSGLWDELATRWICLDAEILPWSAKAQELLRRQYAATATAAENGAARDAVPARAGRADRDGCAAAKVCRAPGCGDRLSGGVPSLLLAGSHLGGLSRGAVSSPGQ